MRQELTPAGAVALLIFFAFAMQCMSTIAVVRRETNGWKWPVLQFTYMTAVAYIAAFAAYNIVGHFISLIRLPRISCCTNPGSTSPALPRPPHRRRLRFAGSSGPT